MTPNEYLKAKLKEETFSDEDPEMKNLRERRDEIKSELETTFSESKPSIKWAGSKAKGTMIKASYDGDITCYFDHETEEDAGDTLEEIYEDVEKALCDKYIVERKTSALRVRSLDDIDLHIDVVPGRYTDEEKHDVFLFQADGDKSRLKTNLQTHIDHIKNSGVRPAIRLSKLWRTVNAIDEAKTFVLELLVAKILSGHDVDVLADQLTRVFTEFKENADELTVSDPANSNNDLTPILDRCRWRLQTVATNTLWQIENNGWEAVYGALEDDDAEENKSQRLKSAVVINDSRTKPWSK